MDALTAAFVAALLLHLGDSPARLVGRLAQSGRPGAVLAGAAIAVLVGNVVAVAFGMLMAPMLRGNGGQMLVAMALLAAGISGLFALRPPKPDKARGGFAGALFGCMALLLGDRTQFVVTALAVRAELPVLAGVGGALGTLAMMALSVVAGPMVLERLPRLWTRTVPALVLIVLALWTGLSAARLI